MSDAGEDGGIPKLAPKKFVKCKVIFGGSTLPNTRSAKKRMRQNEKRRIRNRYFRGRARAQIKDAREAMETEELEEAREATLKAVSALDKAAVKGIIHKNNAARRKSRLMQQLAELEEKLAE